MDCPCAVVPICYATMSEGDVRNEGMNRASKVAEQI